MELLMEKTHLPRRDFYKNLVATAEKGTQVLFLFPEAFHAKAVTEGIPIFHGGLKENEKAEIWNAVKNNKIHALAGTRMALFLPFKKLGRVILDYEHSDSYAELRKPTYHALDIAQKLAEIWDAKLTVISATPRLTTYDLRPTTSMWERREDASSVSIIDMADEKRKGATGLLGPIAIENIAKCMSQNRQTLLFLNRKGEASALLCRDCGKVFRCDSCDSALTVHKDLTLQCHRCRTAQEIPTTCDSCGNTRLKQLGGGVELLEKELNKLFSKARVLRLDRETITKKSTAADLKSIEDADILIATKIIDKPFNLPRLNLSIAVMPDDLLNFPDYRASERVLQILMHIKLLAPKNKLLIQTFMPEHPIFTKALQGNLEDFYKNELETRKSLRLPPFSAS